MVESNLWDILLSCGCDAMVEKEVTQYTTQDLITNVNKLLKYAEQEKMNPAIFMHSLIFTSEFMIQKYNFVPKEIAEIRRQSKKLIDEVFAQPPPSK